MEIPNGVVFTKVFEDDPGFLEWYRLCEPSYEYHVPNTGEWRAGVLTLDHKIRQLNLIVARGHTLIQAVDGHVAPEGATHWRHHDSSDKHVIFYKEVGGKVFVFNTEAAQIGWWVNEFSSPINERPSVKPLPLFKLGIAAGSIKEEVETKTYKAQELF